MLFTLDKRKKAITPMKRITLNDIGWKEENLQSLLYKNLNRVIRDEELIVIAQSRKWQEEPDLLAVDEKGDLWIFELKARESESKNLLQVMRYGQIFGQYQYEDLNDLYEQINGENLLEKHKTIFQNQEIKSSNFNNNQKFVVMTNGLDIKTRQSIKYWRENGIEIIPWIYRIYEKDTEIFLEFNTLRTEDDPLEDVEADYYVVNTDIDADKQNDSDMIEFHKAAAYFDPWKFKIEKKKKGDHVFLYRNGEGIVARGIATSSYKKKDYQDNPEYKNEEDYVPLTKFEVLEEPLSHADTVEITGIYRRFTTCISIDQKSWTLLSDEFSNRPKKSV